EPHHVLAIRGLTRLDTAVAAILQLLEYLPGPLRRSGLLGTDEVAERALPPLLPYPVEDLEQVVVLRGLSQPSVNQPKMRFEIVDEANGAIDGIGINVTLVLVALHELEEMQDKRQPGRVRFELAPWPDERGGQI